jgi:uncharacterized protein involved in exopolysaccharide biosynthesis
MSETTRAFRQAILRHARLPMFGVIAVAVIAFGIASLLPRWYRADTSLLPPQEFGESFGMLANLIETSALSKVGLISTSSTSDIYVEMLKSRRVREPIIDRYRLRERYRESNLDKCLKEFDAHVKTDVLPSQILVVSVEDRDPKMAADIANALVQRLDEVNQEVRANQARRSREFLDEQLAQAGQRLREAETKLADYERAHGVVSGSEAAAVEGVADLLARKLALQVRRTWIQSYSDRNNPALQAVGSELAAVDREIVRLPGLKQEASRRTLDVEIQRRVYTLLTAQLEETRLEEQRKTGNVSVLDPARPPSLKSRPKKGIITLIAAGVALALASAWVFTRARADLEAAGFRRT